MELDKFKTKDAVIAPKSQKQEHRFLGTMIRRPGLTLFEYDSKSKIVRRRSIRNISIRTMRNAINSASVVRPVCRHATGVCTFKR